MCIGYVLVCIWLIFVENCSAWNFLKRTTDREVQDRPTTRFFHALLHRNTSVRSLQFNSSRTSFIFPIYTRAIFARKEKCRSTDTTAALCDLHALPHISCDCASNYLRCLTAIPDEASMHNAPFVRTHGQSHYFISANLFAWLYPSFENNVPVKLVAVRLDFRIFDKLQQPAADDYL